jgi:prevent-host-death family protein
MESITHREMRNNSGEILRRVEAGESFQVTNNGRPVAVISPAGRSVLEELIAQGRARPATMPIAEALAKIKPAKLPDGLTSKDIIDDVRGPWG